MIAQNPASNNINKTHLEALKAIVAAINAPPLVTGGPFGLSPSPPHQRALSKPDVARPSKGPTVFMRPFQNLPIRFLLAQQP